MKVWIDSGGSKGAKRLFGITLIERHLMVLARLGGIDEVILSAEAALTAAVPAGLKVAYQIAALPLGARLAAAAVTGPLVAIDGATVIDPRLLDVLVAGGGITAAFGGEDRERTAILRLDPAVAGRIDRGATSVLQVAEQLTEAGVVAELPADAVPSFIVKLRRSVDHWLFAMPDKRTRNRRGLWLFWSNYKGSTDLLTRYVFPPLVWPLVRWSTRAHIHPNWITLVSILLAIAVVPLFWYGEFLAGFILAYIMCILDSVDGKVARLTMTDSKLGDLMDHGLDVIHPPFWYFAWAWGLGGRHLHDPLILAALVLIGFYVADRLVLKVAKQRFGRGLHAVTQLDTVLRSIIARRNTNMALLTIALLFGQGVIGFYVIAAWQGLTVLWHLVRTLTVSAPDGRQSIA